MSTLDRARQLDIKDSIDSLIGEFGKFYDIEELDLDKISDLSPELINNMIRTEYKQKIIKDRFNVTIDYQDMITNSKKRKSISKSRSGREEMKTVLATLLDKVLSRPRNMLEKLF